MLNEKSFGWVCVCLRWVDTLDKCKAKADNCSRNMVDKNKKKKEKIFDSKYNFIRTILFFKT
jgi:hypothetical protein